MAASFLSTDTATTEIYTLSLHDALPISPEGQAAGHQHHHGDGPEDRQGAEGDQDRKSTRLNSSHEWISYAVFCLKKKKTIGRARNLMEDLIISNVAPAQQAETDADDETE